MSSAGVMTSSEFSTRKRPSQLRVGRSILGGAMDFPREQNDDSAKRWRKSSHTQRRRVGHPGGGVLAMEQHLDPLQARRCPLITVVEKAAAGLPHSISTP